MSAHASATCPKIIAFPIIIPAYSLLDFYGTLLERAPPATPQRIQEVLELVGLKERMHYKIRTYSKGMKQRLGIAQAILHEPESSFSTSRPTASIRSAAAKSA